MNEKDVTTYPKKKFKHRPMNQSMYAHVITVMVIIVHVTG